MLTTASLQDKARCVWLSPQKALLSAGPPGTQKLPLEGAEFLEGSVLVLGPQCHGAVQTLVGNTELSARPWLL